MIFGMFGSKKNNPSETEAAIEEAPQVAAEADKPTQAPSPTQAFAMREAEKASEPPAEPVQETAAREIPANETTALETPAKEILPMTEQDVVAAYKLFLRRNPENKTVIESRIGLPRERMLVNFITAKEFIKYPENINLILQTAQAIEIQGGVSKQEGTP